MVLGSTDGAALASIRSLAKAGFQVDMACLGMGSAADHSRHLSQLIHLPDPLMGTESVCEQLEEILKTQHYNVLIPICDRALSICIHYHKTLSQHTRLATPDPHGYGYAHNKEQLYNLAKKRSVPVPNSITIQSLEDLYTLKNKLPFPCYAKPIFSVQIVSERTVRFKVKKIETFEQLEEFCRDNLINAPIMIQEPCPGIGVGIYLIASHGTVLSMVQQNRIHEPLDGGGSSYRQTVVMDPLLKSYTHTLIEAIQWTGVAMIEFKGEAHSNSWRLMEINGRLWGSLALTIRSGLDFPVWMYHLFVHGNVDPELLKKQPLIGVRQRNLKKDLAWVVKRLLKRPQKIQTLVGWLASFRHLLTHREGLDVEWLSDPMPSVADWYGLTKTVQHKVFRLIRRKKLHILYATQEKKRVLQAQEVLRHKDARILFICRGNIGRSRFAEHYTRQILGRENVSSAGTIGLFNRLPTAQVEWIARDSFGVDFSGGKSRMVDQTMLDQTDIVFIMDYRNLEEVSHFDQKGRLILLLGSLTNQGAIEDPYHQDNDAIFKILERIKQTLDRAL